MRSHYVSVVVVLVMSFNVATVVLFVSHLNLEYSLVS